MRAILTYHSLDGSGSPISTAPEIFESHVDWLRRSRTAVLPLERITDPCAPADAVALTFDDGFVNFAGAAWPALRAAGFPVTLFVVTDRAGQDNCWTGSGDGGIPALPLLGWPELRRLAAEGVTLGSHSRTHAWLPELDARSVEDEVSGARFRIQTETGQDVRAFAYPFGAISDRVEAAVARHHGMAVTTRLAWLAPANRPLALPRLDAFYLRGFGAIEGFGTLRFRSHFFCRSVLRSIRGSITGGYGRPVPRGGIRRGEAGGKGGVRLSPDRGDGKS